MILREAFKKKKPKKSLEFSKLSGPPPPPPPKVWKVPKILGFFQVAQKHIETNKYVLIHPETEEKKFTDQILTVYCTILYSMVPYSTGYHPPTKVKFFSLHFWMNQTISNVFPKLLEKTQKNQKKSLELAETPSPPVWKIPNFFWVFFLEGFP